VSRTPITPEGARRLREELERLWTVERPRVTEEVSAAAALGDRSETAEYLSGKTRRREIDRRVRFRRKRREEVAVLEPGRVADRAKVFFGAWVALEDDEGRERRYRVVGPDEIAPERGWISIQSPLGRVLLGRQVGDEVEVARPAGRVTYTLLEVSYDPEPGP
jgi:transcription elongation factor GreB